MYSDTSQRNRADIRNGESELGALMAINTGMSSRLDLILTSKVKSST